MMLCFSNDCSCTLLLALTLTHSLFVERERGGEREREGGRREGGRREGERGGGGGERGGEGGRERERG